MVQKLILVLVLSSVVKVNAQPSNRFMCVFLNPLEVERASSEIQVIENEHLRVISRLAEQGILVNAGPFEGGGEMLLFKTETRDQTEALLQKDPAITSELYKAEILGWSLRFGGICDPVIPYEMKTYSFVRYTPANEIAGFKTNMDLETKTSHQRHIEGLLMSGKVVVEGVFSGNDGGFLVYEEGSLKDRIQDDPAIQNGYMKISEKTIWLNKGSFCDN